MQRQEFYGLGMQIDEHLDRPGLSPALRVLVAVAATTWRADWSRLKDWTTRAAALEHDRAGFEEALLMCVLFCGFPRAITAWGHVSSAWPAKQAPRGGGLPAEEQLAAGSALFADIYGKNDAQVRDMLRSFHGELHDFVLEAAYGRILTRPGLSAQSRELIAVGVLAAQDQPRQFLGHAKGARRLGATREQLAEVLITTFDGDEARAHGWVAQLPSA